MRWITGVRISDYRWLWIGTLTLLFALIATSSAGAQKGSGYWYTVRHGDSWSSIAVKTGVSIAELQRANPQAIRRNRWLYAGERLWIPLPGQTSGYWYIVRWGDSWTSIARRTGISVRRLLQANPQAVHRSLWLYRGERIWIPSAPLPQLTPTPPTVPPSIACPTDLISYGSAIIEFLSETNGNVSALAGWLSQCGVVTPDTGEVRTADFTGDGGNEVVTALTSPQPELPAPSGALFVLRKAEVWTIDFQALTDGQVELLDAADVNQDGQMDLVWTETTCGAHTCFGTVHLISWTGTAFQNWIDGTLSMAYPEVRLEDTTDGSGQEIIVHGGVIGSVGAGPQRAWTEIWASPEGAPYTRVSQVYDPSNCLYHTVLDANTALLNGRSDQFAQAITLYRKAIEDPTLVACWSRPNELEELRTFSTFRLALAYAYQGDQANAEATVTELSNRYPGAIYTQIADIWWTAYRPTEDMRAACAAVNAFVAGPPSHPEAYEMLADYGYANPTFTAADICPIVP
jgi:hypothetical protein